MKFTNIIKRLDKFRDDPGLLSTKKGAVELFCADCDFYKESDEDLECGAFQLIRLLVEKGKLTVEDISDAVGD